MSGVRWYALVAKEVVGPFETMDTWYIAHGGPGVRRKNQRGTEAL